MLVHKCTGFWCSQCVLYSTDKQNLPKSDKDKKMITKMFFIVLCLMLMICKGMVIG